MPFLAKVSASAEESAKLLLGISSNEDKPQKDNSVIDPTTTTINTDVINEEKEVDVINEEKEETIASECTKTTDKIPPLTTKETTNKTSADTSKDPTSDNESSKKDADTNIPTEVTALVTTTTPTSASAMLEKNSTVTTAFKNPTSDKESPTNNAETSIVPEVTTLDTTTAPTPASTTLLKDSTMSADESQFAESNSLLPKGTNEGTKASSNETALVNDGEQSTQETFTLTNATNDDDLSVDADGYTGSIDLEAIPPQFVPNNKMKYKTFTVQDSDCQSKEQLLKMSYLCHL